MLGNFKANLSYNNFLLLVYGLLLKWPIFLRPQLPQTTTTDAYFYKLIVHALDVNGKNYPIIFSVVVVILVFIQAIGLNQIVIQQKLFHHKVVVLTQQTLHVIMLQTVIQIGIFRLILN